MVHKIIIIKWGHNIGVDIIIKSVEPGISIFGLANFEYVCEFYAYIYMYKNLKYVYCLKTLKKFEIIN